VVHGGACVMRSGSRGSADFTTRAVARCVRDASADAAIVATDAAPTQSQSLALAASPHESSRRSSHQAQFYR
jgi:hypothetical protein